MCVSVCVCEERNFLLLGLMVNSSAWFDRQERRRGGKILRQGGAKKNRHFGTSITIKAHDDDDNGGRDPSGIAQPSGLHPKWVWRQRKDADGNAPRRLGRKTWQILKKRKTAMTRITVSRGGYCYGGNYRIVPMIVYIIIMHMIQLLFPMQPWTR